ncbi:MAG TPA: GDSL-type esterase/lipase family protein [Blastocatellia bacterium]|nr:GDSL-type esterase/lipase family protein [Blastocatellia bacterium]
MSTKRLFILAFIAAVIATLTAARESQAQSLTFTPYKASGIYDVGEKVGWTVTRSAEATGDYTYTVKKNDQDVIKAGRLDFSSGRATIEVMLDEPAMVYVQVSPADDSSSNASKPMALGAAVAPEHLQPSAPRPADFDRFWKSKIAMLKKIPERALLTPKESGKPDVEYAIVQMDHINGTHIYGQMAKPSKPGKFPALVIFQWASPPYPLQRQWVTDRAAEGWLTLNIEPHNVLPDQPPSYYSALPEEIKHYERIGQTDREKNYFLQMYLADYRAVEYITHRKDWDGKTLVVMGTSMGGQQSLSVAGLHPKITHLIVNEPAGCDTNGSLHGRAAGYPNWPADNPQAMQTALYFDPVNFASHIKATSMVAMGFVDTVAPPVGIWIAFNQIQGQKEAVPMIDSPHNHVATPAQQYPVTSRSAEWLNTLVKGGELKLQRILIRKADAIPPADQPAPRTDENSQIAHAQLLEKARRGGTDVYFLGDSITRRWGTSDEQYKDFLANWRQNFFGWNAADFGWGGDTTQNILWRLANGELDNVNPKVIVVMAGTNNVGKLSPQGDNDPRVADITRGIKAILDVCRQKAPTATIILMGITPRNDNMAVMPIINKINDNIARLADGKKIRFVNLNDRLADASGKLYEGMTTADGLHLDVKGYQVWADALKPIFTELLGPPAKTDHAPPPTGDPRAQSNPGTRH